MRQRHAGGLREARHLHRLTDRNETTQRKVLHGPVRKFTGPKHIYVTLSRLHSFNNMFADSSQLNPLTAFKPALLYRCRTLKSFNDCTPRAKFSASFGSQKTAPSSPAISRKNGRSLTTAGVPSLSASASGRPKPSDLLALTMIASSARSAEYSSSLTPL